MELNSLVGKIESGQAVTPTTPITPTTDQNAATTPSSKSPSAIESDFEKLLKGLVKVNQENKVSEEALFAGVVRERVAKLKGEDVAKEYDTILEKTKAAATHGDFVAMEDAAKNALKELRSQSKLSAEEADQVYSEAFAASQLDGNTDALYDDRGGAGDATIAVDTMEAALLAARTIVEKFDSKEQQVSTRSLDEASAGKGSASGGSAIASLLGSSVSVSADASSVADSTTPKGTTVDGANGFLFKPIAESNGNLAVLAPEALKGLVDSVVLKDLAGNEIDRGNSTGYGDAGTREKFSFSKPGGSYPKDLTVEIRMQDGSVKSYTIPDPSKRYD